VILGLVAGFAAGPFWFVFGDDIREYLSRIPFNSTAWKNADMADSKNPVRLRMVDDLLKRHRLVGRTRAEVEQLLGPPTETGKFGDYDYAYWLGPERGFISIDSEWLALKVEGGRVTQAKVVRA
jgi:hypothetical protein